MSQVERLREVLSDGLWHETPEILERVYGSDRLGIARIAARVNDLKHKLPTSQTIESRPSRLNPAVWEYRVATIKPQPLNYELFR